MENTFNFEQASYSDLLAEAKRLNDLVSGLSNRLLYTDKAFQNRDRQYKEGGQLIKSAILEEVITDEDYIKQLVELFDIQIMKEVTFTLNIEVSGTVEIPLGSELDEYSFDLDGITYDGDSVNIDYENVSIENWEFTE